MFSLSARWLTIKKGTFIIESDLLVTSLCFLLIGRNYYIINAWLMRDCGSNEINEIN